ncbi:MAG: hypothetical protein WDN24_14260 [Sphingomonas sp.]
MGVKSASIHYHFPHQGRSRRGAGASLLRGRARRPGGDRAEHDDPALCLRLYAGVFRRALGERQPHVHVRLPGRRGRGPARGGAGGSPRLRRSQHRMAGGDAGGGGPGRRSRVTRRRAHAIFAAIGGAQLAARSRGDAAVFDRIVESYRATGLIPG